MTSLLQQRRPVGPLTDLQAPESFVASKHGQRSTSFDPQDAAVDRFPIDSELSDGFTRTKQSLDQDLDASTAVLVPPESGRNDASVVENQKVIGPEQTGKIDKKSVIDLATASVEGQQTTRRALGQWVLSDQSIRQIKLKIGYFHRLENDPGAAQLSV